MNERMASVSFLFWEVRARGRTFPLLDITPSSSSRCTSNREVENNPFGEAYCQFQPKGGSAASRWTIESSTIEETHDAEVSPPQARSVDESVDDLQMSFISSGTAFLFNFGAGKTGGKGVLDRPSFDSRRRERGLGSRGRVWSSENL